MARRASTSGQAAVGLRRAPRGLVHRDIKPAHLLLTRDPATGTMSLVKVLDMGLARIEQKPHRRERHT